MQAKLFATSIIILMTASCKQQPSQDKSDVKWAHMDDFGGFGFAELLPNQTIAVCGQGSTSSAVGPVKKAILDWAGAIGRDRNMTVTEGCNGGDMMVTLTTEDQQGICGSGAAAYTTPTGRGQFKIVYCRPSYLTSVDINLHEVGHIWMQCDRYGGGDLSQAQFGDGCSRTNTDNNAVSSAMMAGGPNHPQRITEDDVKAMQALANRQDIPQNRQWANLPPGSAGGGGTTPPTAPTLPGTTPPPSINPPGTNPVIPPNLNNLPNSGSTNMVGCSLLNQRLQLELPYRPITREESTALALCVLNGIVTQTRVPGR